MKTSVNKLHYFRRQQGVVLFIALIVLVAMTLAGIALIRSVDTVNQIAGNLAFKQGATLSGDSAVETARTWLVAQTAGALWNNSAANGYYSSTPTVGQGTEVPWDQYDWTGSAVALPADAAGNQVSYVVHRLCKLAGDPGGAGNTCLATVVTGATPRGSSKGAGVIGPSGTPQYYYRITNRVTGPRNTVTYMQTLIQI
ncbi:MAG TPA: hypothetical protein VLV32_03575 [Burkholderiales bacterium]|nr:hypothetical protein [Burkholderiales bacterium]